jgi:hypothetical protein
MNSIENRVSPVFCKNIVNFGDCVMEFVGFEERVSRTTGTMASRA